jgi:ComF family protein
MSLKSFWLDLFFPLECLGCRAPGLWLCEKCFRSLRFTNKKYNLGAPNLDKLFVAGTYDDPLLAGLIKKLKFQPLPELGPILSRFLIMFWQGINFRRLEFSPLAPSRPILVAPVPLSDKRERRRGFNQAESLAAPLAKHFNYQLTTDLKRIKHCQPQTGLNEKERAVNVQGAFRWTGPRLAERAIILIDDVATTGATLNECARILKNAGAGAVYGLVLAKG